MKNILILLILVSCKGIKSDKKVDQKENTIEAKIESKNSITNSTKKVKVDESFNKNIDTLPNNVIALIQRDYSILNVSYGDANLDGLIDKIIVIKKNTEEETSDYASGKQTKRPLLLLIKQSDNSYKIAYRNDNAVYCVDCGGIGGDPFTGTTIKNGYFSVEHGIHGGKHWDNVTTFKYDKLTSNWFLDKDHYVSYSLNNSTNENTEPLIKDTDIMKTKKDFGKISFDKFDIYQENKY